MLTVAYSCNDPDSGPSQSIRVKVDQAGDGAFKDLAGAKVHTSH